VIVDDKKNTIFHCRLIGFLPLGIETARPA